MDTRPPADPRSASLADLDAPAQPTPGVRPRRWRTPRRFLVAASRSTARSIPDRAVRSISRRRTATGGSPGAASDARAAEER